VELQTLGPTPTEDPTTTSPDTGMLTVAGAARLLGVHANTIRSWTDQGRLPCVRINRRGDRRYKAAELRSFLATAVDAKQRHAEASPRLRLLEEQWRRAEMLLSISNEISGQELVRELAVRLNAQYRFLHAPATFESARSRDALLAEPSIADALAEASRADLAFVGIGTPSRGSSAAILASLNLSPADQSAFWAAQPVGDVAARYYDAQGQPVHGVVEDRILGVSIDDLMRIPNVVGVAHGRAKTPGVLGALRGHIIDSLVCDDTLARSLLSEARTPSTHDLGGI
jgi:excisionase family DNA binding protein